MGKDGVCSGTHADDLEYQGTNNYLYDETGNLIPRSHRGFPLSRLFILIRRCSLQLLVAYALKLRGSPP